MTDTGLPSVPDRCWFVEPLPFECRLSLFVLALKAGVRAGRVYLNNLIEKSEAPEGASYAGVIFDPTRMTDNVIAIINLDGSDTSRLVNGAGKVDWMQLHPDLDFEVAIRKQPWTIGKGQFLWGHAVTHRGFPAGGSGLSDEQDRAIMRVIIDAIADNLAPLMSKELIDKRDAHNSWAGDGPSPQYTWVLDLLGQFEPEVVES